MMADVNAGQCKPCNRNEVLGPADQNSSSEVLVTVNVHQSGSTCWISHVLRDALRVLYHLEMVDGRHQTSQIRYVSITTTTIINTSTTIFYFSAEIMHQHSFILDPSPMQSIAE
ncbi:uncharacterized protein LAJ45_03312 [Morchella importuna]|uniref:uncharacterized protein n=1 Tax=Morchella importuna TaxID=1174673 RepID=UPI001E8DED02|nr:uncharacterized protein LAJ45_03312 [Morchella importuna]KAH8152472.1 hypothetical protein LAJ45_03312 [Morchella importuna]